MKAFISRRRRKTGSTIAEFGPVLLIIFLIILFPFLNLFFYLCGAATVQMLVTESARAAATAENRVAALQTTQVRANGIVKGGLGQVFRLNPVGSVSGSTLYITLTPAATGVPTPPDAFAADSALPPSWRPSQTGGNYIYQYTVKGQYLISPFFPMSIVPFIGKFPVIGVPAPMYYTHSATVENLIGLEN